MSNTGVELLNLLIRHEQALAKLYDTFAIIYPRHTLFWQNLAADEHKHAHILAGLRTDSNVDKWLQVETRLKPQAIKVSIGYIEGQVARSRKGGSGIWHALAIARDLESALLERYFIKLQDSVPLEIGLVLKTLAGETADHFKAVVALLKDEKSRF